MSTINVIKFLSDLTGHEIPQGEVNTIEFSIDGKSYEIDLNDQEAADIRSALAPYVAVARKVTTTTKRAAASSGGTDREENRVIRTWLLENGYKVSDRGRISADMKEAYYAGQAAPAPAEVEEQDALWDEEETVEESPQEPSEPTDDEVIAWHKSKDYKISLKKDGSPNGLMVDRYKKAHVA